MEESLSDIIFRVQVQKHFYTHDWHRALMKSKFLTSFDFWLSVSVQQQADDCSTSLDKDHIL